MIPRGVIPPPSTLPSIYYFWTLGFGGWSKSSIRVPVEFISLGQEGARKKRKKENAAHIRTVSHTCNPLPPRALRNRYIHTYLLVDWLHITARHLCICHQFHPTLHMGFGGIDRIELDWTIDGGWCCWWCTDFSQSIHPFCPRNVGSRDCTRLSAPSACNPLTYLSMYQI